MCLIKTQVDLLKECGFLKNDINCLCLESNKILLEQNEDHLDNIKKGEESIVEKISNG